MNKYVVHIIVSCVCLLIPVLGVWYGIWDSQQPKTGPVGNGYTPPTFLQLLPLISCFLLGLLNLPWAIILYREDRNKRNRILLDFFQLDTDEARQAMLVRARKVASAALLRYDLQWESLQFIQVSDAITYKIETTTKEKFLLRIHTDKWSKEVILSELSWLQELNESPDLTVPVGAASCDGQYALEIETDEDFRNPIVTIMRWVEGEAASGALSDRSVYNIGCMIARLHVQAAGFVAPPNFVRPQWGAASFKRDMEKLERYHERFLSAEAWKAYQDAAEKIIVEFSSMQRDNQNYGLIHADLHTGNMVFQREQPFPIDFGRCGYGYFLYDLASSLLALDPRQRAMVIEGYKQVKTLENNYISSLECFFVMVMIENYAHHCSNPAEIADLIAQQRYAQAYIREFLSARSFLFEAVEPLKLA